jgi:hypothetical protein
MKTENFIRLLAEDLPSGPARQGIALTRWMSATALVTGAAFLLFAGARADLLGGGLLPSIMKVFMGALLAWAAIGGATSLARPEASVVQPLRRLVTFAAFLAFLFATELMFRGLDGWLVRMFGKSIVGCLTVIPLLALLPLVVSLHALRSGATTSPTFAGGLAGLASAGVAIIAYGVFCTEDSLVFVATWYSLAAIMVAGLGAVLGRTLLRW